MNWSVFKGTQIDSPRVAVALILTALLFLSLQDGLVKFASGTSSLWQFQIIRSLINLAIIFVGLAMAGGWSLIWPKNPKMVMARTAAIMGTMIFFFSGAPFLTLPEMGAGLYTYPIFMTLLSMVFLRERIGAWRLSAIVMAATGAVLIIRPSGQSFHAAQILPIFSGFFYSINAIILRKYCRDESPVTMAAWASFGFLVICSIGAVLIGLSPISPAMVSEWPFLLNAWPHLTTTVLGIAAFCAVCNVTGNVLIVKAYQSAELSGLAPVDYSYLIFATFWGYIFFSGLPNMPTILGMILIAAAGILTAWRQRQEAAPLSFTNP